MFRHSFMQLGFSGAQLSAMVTVPLPTRSIFPPVEAPPPGGLVSGDLYHLAPGHRTKLEQGRCVTFAGQLTKAEKSPLHELTGHTASQVWA